MVLSLVLDGVVDGVFCCTDGGLDHPSLGGVLYWSGAPPSADFDRDFFTLPAPSGAKAILLHC